MGVVSLNNGTPLHALESVKEDIDNIKAVIVVGIDADGRVNTTWSKTKLSDLTFMLKALELDIHDYMREKAAHSE